MSGISYSELEELELKLQVVKKVSRIRAFHQNSERKLGSCRFDHQALRSCNACTEVDAKSLLTEAE